MNIDEMKNKISMALKDPILQQGFEIICKENTELKEENKVLAQNLEDTEILNKTLVNRNAEFGYNKANEWHYVKDGKYPKENQLVMVYRVNPLGANIAITNWYDSYKDTKVIAWKEIILPELPKESE